MDQECFENLLQSLPQDLASYVFEDNLKFKEECDNWDAEQKTKALSAIEEKVTEEVTEKESSELEVSIYSVLVTFDYNAITMVRSWKRNSRTSTPMPNSALTFPFDICSK